MVWFVKFRCLDHEISNLLNRWKRQNTAESAKIIDNLRHTNQNISWSRHRNLTNHTIFGYYLVRAIWLWNSFFLNMPSKKCRRHRKSLKMSIFRPETGDFSAPGGRNFKSDPIFFIYSSSWICWKYQIYHFETWKILLVKGGPLIRFIE